MAQVGNKEIEDVATESFWKVQIFSYDASGNVIYIARNRVQTALVAATDWTIWKFTYNANNQLIMSEGPLVGAQENREALAWRA